MILRAALTLAVASSLVLGACTLAGVGGSGTASVPDQAPTFTVVDAPADLLAVPVGDALAARRGAAIRVTGALFVAPDGTMLLCSAIAESFPPQCGGDRLVVHDLDPTTLQLETANDVSWAESIELVGIVEG